MKRCVFPAILVLAWTLWQSPARAEAPWLLFDGCNWSFPNLCDLWRQRKCWCPDDYCSKSLPCVPTNARGCVDDYCPKTLPCVPPNPKGCVDDYCPKTCPILLGSNCDPRYLCGPPENCLKCGCGKPGQ
jgi:hypothetical protein